MDLRISIKDYRRGKLENQTSSSVRSPSFPVPVAEGASQIAGKSREVVQCRHASVWRELVAFRAGEMQPGAGDTSSRQTEADATAFPIFARDERAGNDGRRAGAKLARSPCQFPPVGPGGFIPD